MTASIAAKEQRLNVAMSHGHRLGAARREITGSGGLPIRLQAAREVSIIGTFIFFYFFVRGLMHSKAADAIVHARDLIQFEQNLGIFQEMRIQGWALGHTWLVEIVNAVYIYGHWPMLISTLVWLLVAHRDQFPVYRTALLASGAIGLVCFVLYPMAPPRFLLDLGFVDTVTLGTESYRVLQPPAFTNQYAAMPSLHVGWNLLMGIAIFTFTTNRFWKIFAIVMPIVMYSATILTANHYMLDGVAGSAVALIGLAVAWKISAPKPVSRDHMPVYSTGDERVHSTPLVNAT